MNKLIIKEEELKNFSVDLVKDFEGCASALRFLKGRFGNSNYDLSKCGLEIKRLIYGDNKSDWAINFMLNLLKPQYRLSFYLKTLQYHLDNMYDDELKNFISNCFNTYSKRCSKKNHQELKNKISSIMSEIQLKINIEKKEKSRDELNHQLYVLESVNFFLDDSNKKFTRHITDALMKLAEAKVFINVVQYQYEDNIRDTSVSLMEYLELW